MSGSTNISWTDNTWNPWSGCIKVSEGCDNCYAEAIGFKYKTGQPFVAGNKITLKPEKLTLPTSRGKEWRGRKRVFVNSMSDFFVPGVPGWMLQEAWNVMRQTPQHTYQILTKRPVPALRIMTELGLDPLPNVWMGVSVETQEWADIRTDQLRALSASLYFLSVEPMLEGIVLDLEGISWVITGGESGNHHRPFDQEWAKAIRDQCLKAGVAFFHKQHGGALPGGDAYLDSELWRQFPGDLAEPERAVQGALI